MTCGPPAAPATARIPGSTPGPGRSAGSVSTKSVTVRAICRFVKQKRNERSYSSMSFFGW